MARVCWGARMLGVGRRGVVFSRPAVPGCWGQLDLAFFGLPFITGKTFICISPAFPEWPQVRFCSGVEGREKLLCCPWCLRQAHHRCSAVALLEVPLVTPVESSELLASVMVSWPLCPQRSASLFLKLSDLGLLCPFWSCDWYRTFDRSKSWWPQKLSGHLLGLWVMIWRLGVSFDGDIIGFSSVNDQRLCLGDSLRAQGSWCSGSWSVPARGLSVGTLSNVDITEHQLSAGHYVRLCGRERGE